MPKKNIARLVPVKKNVVNKRTGSVNDVTYYIDPNKDDGKHIRKAGDPDPAQNNDTNVGPKNKDKTDLTDPVSSMKLKDKDTDKNTHKTQSKDSLLDGVKDFEDFGKKGIDPTAARQFFCNM